MSSFLGVLILVGGVIVLFQVFGLFPRAVQVLHTSKRAFDVIKNPKLAEEQKESLLQAYSLSLLRACFDLMIRGIGGLALPAGLVWALAFSGVLSFEAVLSLMLSWPFVLGGLLVAIMACGLLHRRGAP